MSQFQFTIPGASVLAITGSSNPVGISLSEGSFFAVADRGLSRQTTNNILTASFGDGYEQRVRDGINFKQDIFSLNFVNRKAQEINLIAGYLDSKTGLNFNLTVSDTFLAGSVSESTIRVVCDSYNVTYLREEIYNLTCQLRRVYEP